MTGIVQSDASKTLIFVQWVNFVLLIYYFVPLLSNLFMPQTQPCENNKIVSNKRL